MTIQSYRQPSPTIDRYGHQSSPIMQQIARWFRQALPQTAETDIKRNVQQFLINTHQPFTSPLSQNMNMLHIYTQPFYGRDNNSNIHRPRSSDAKIDWQRVMYMYTTHTDAWLVITMTISVFCRLGVIRLHRMHSTGCALLRQSSVVCLWVWVYVCLYICWSLGCSGKFWFGGTVSET